MLSIEARPHIIRIHSHRKWFYAPNPSFNNDRTAFNAASCRGNSENNIYLNYGDNADNIPFISKRVLEQSKKRVACSALPAVSGDPWVSQ